MNKTEKFINKALIVHNSIYDYSNVEYISVETNVKIICPIHGEFEQSPRIHLYKKGGCNKCAVDRSKQVNTKTTTQFIDQSTEIHKTKYDYSLVKYINATTPVDIICPEHGIFQQVPSSHTRGFGCKKCAVRMSSNEFIQKAQTLHISKYDYANTIYSVGREKIKILCPIHGEFNQKAESHLKGCGCPICALEYKKFISKGEEEINEIINQLDIKTITNTHSVITPLELDIVIPTKNIAIEYNGVFWHSELMGKGKQYHLNKTKRCNEKNFRLIHVFEHEWVNKKNIVISRIQNILGKSTRIYARKCTLNILNSKEARKFLNENHIQGFGSASIHIGLHYDDKLVALVSFGLSRFNTNIQWELIRFCNLREYSVVGGASKLFKYFVNEYKPNSIVSYSDKRWNTGDLYINLGFSFSHQSTPNYFYFHKNKTLVLYSRSAFQKHKLKDKLEVFDSTLTEWENMQNNGYNRIWDCGNDVFVWEAAK